MIETWEDPQCGHCGEDVGCMDFEGEGLTEMPLLICPICGREGCPECMPAGHGCPCPDCDEGDDDE